MSWLSDYLDSLLNWIADLVIAIFAALFDMAEDFITYILEKILLFILSALEFIVVPEWLSDGLQYFISLLDPSILFFLDACGFPEAVAILGLGYAFRLTRKIVTFGFW